jgi:putative membrane-bound dehydrogenase-like protein
MHRRFALLAVVLFAPSAAAQLSPERALAAMKVAPGFQCELFASEPLFVNPTSIDVDHKGRVWVCESVNYRHTLFKRPPVRKEGDRIVVLVDKTGEGKATEAVTFYQSPEVLAPIGVAVAPYPDGKGQKVFVCQSPNIWVFEDKDGDLKADGPPKVLLTGFRGIDHDHGVHGINIGPDGKLYFTVGDQGVKDLQSSDGKGRKWTSNDTDCRAGTVWRCDQDGTNLELIAHNFRNNYECCVDSFGEIWLSDNDDDGNQQTRICYVMPGGNYGYHPRGPGQSHWHEEQPGIVPKVLRTGFGSPTGICFYEGTLLPEKYRGNLLHCDAGPREVRAFFKKPKGAGYELEKEVLLTSPDTWFRPSDVCVAPDGSVFVADWYDPGVGGHGMGDTTRGRIYRLTPTGHKGYKVPEVKAGSATEAVELLGSPNLATEHLGRQVLSGMVTSDKDLMKLITPLVKAGPLPPLVPRTLWLLPNIAGKKNPQSVIQNTLMHKGDRKPYPEDLRILGARILDSQFGPTGVFDTNNPVSDLVNNPEDAGIRWRFGHAFEEEKFVPYDRDLVLLLRRSPSDKFTQSAFFAFAVLYDGKDPFFLHALNIACGTDPKRRDEILADFDKHFPEWNDKVADLVFELRPKSAVARLDKLLVDPKLTAAQKARIVDILAASDSVEAGKTMLGVLTGDHPADVKARALDSLRRFLPGKWKGLHTENANTLTLTTDRLLSDRATVVTGLQLVAAGADPKWFGRVKGVAGDEKGAKEVRVEAVRTLGRLRGAESVAALRAVTDPALKLEAVKALAALGSGPGKDDTTREALSALEGLFTDARTGGAVRLAALDALAGTPAGTRWLLDLKRDGKFPVELTAAAGRLLRNSPFQGERNRALQLFAAAAKLDLKSLPAPAELAKRAGNAEAGKLVWAKSATGDAQCLKCHSVRGTGGQIGPDLSMIGKKASKENLFESILQPSKAIADQYVAWKVDTADGQSITGLLIQETADAVTLRDANGKDHVIPAKNIDGKKKSLTSLMPDDLVKGLAEAELVDLVAYLGTLQTPAYTPESWHVVGPFLRAADLKAGIAQDFGPPAAAFDAKATFLEWAGPSSGPKPKDLGWAVVRPGADGKIELGGAGGKVAVNYAFKSIESPGAQEVTILLGYQGLARVWVNGVMVHTTTPGRKDTDGPDTVTVQLRRGANPVYVKVASEAAAPAFTCTVLSAQELKGK